MVSCYSIDTVDSIKQIQCQYKDKFEHKSIAQELIQNSLNEDQKGELMLSDNLITINIKDLSPEDMEGSHSRIDSGLQRARVYYTDKEARLKSLDTIPQHSRSHGRGFLLVFLLGWDICTLQGVNSLLIAAIKP
jgi:hypothetical protein